MIKYKNISFSAKTFYGVEFAPGEIKAVPGFINSSSMVRVPDNPKSDLAKANLSGESAIPSTRGRKKKTVESEKVSVADTEIKTIETISEEETSNGNPS